jgi:hypothetical protein
MNQDYPTDFGLAEELIAEQVGQPALTAIAIALVEIARQLQKLNEQQEISDNRDFLTNLWGS